MEHYINFEGSDFEIGYSYYIKYEDGVNKLYYNGVFTPFSGKLMFPHRARHTFKNGLLHSYNDAPAGIAVTGKMTWYKDGKLHRESGPAIIETSGYMLWYFEGYQCEFKTFLKKIDPDVAVMLALEYGK